MWTTAFPKRVQSLSQASANLMRPRTASFRVPPFLAVLFICIGVNAIPSASAGESDAPFALSHSALSFSRQLLEVDQGKARLVLAQARVREVDKKGKVLDDRNRWLIMLVNQELLPEDLLKFCVTDLTIFVSRDDLPELRGKEITYVDGEFLVK